MKISNLCTKAHRPCGFSVTCNCTVVFCVYTTLPWPRLFWPKRTWYNDDRVNHSDTFAPMNIMTRLDHSLQLFQVNFDIFQTTTNSNSSTHCKVENFSSVTHQRETWLCPWGTFLRQDRVPPCRQVQGLENIAEVLDSVADLSWVANHTTSVTIMFNLRCCKN